MHPWKARTTKGECDQYHEWNRSTFSPVIYDFDGSDNVCQWFPFPNAVDETPDSVEGTCRAKNATCFELYDSDNCEGTSTTLNDTNGERQDYCIPNDLDTLGDIYCGFNYSMSPHECSGSPESGVCGSTCELYTPPGYNTISESVSEIDKGQCVSDGVVQYDPETGENLGLIMSDQDCNDIIRDSENNIRDGAMSMCTNYRGYGCLWEPYERKCIPKVLTDSQDLMLNSCNETMAHVPSNYDLNLLEEQGINLSEYSDNDNKDYPYKTSKYLCDVCHVRDTDLNNMKELTDQAVADQAVTDSSSENKLKYYMLRKYVDFNGEDLDRSTNVSISPHEYCENSIDQGGGVQFNPFQWELDD